MYGSPPRTWLYIATFGETWRTQLVISDFHSICKREELLPVGETEVWWSKIHKDTSIMRTLIAQGACIVRDRRLGPGDRAQWKRHRKDLEVGVGKMGHREATRRPGLQTSI